MRKHRAALLVLALAAPSVSGCESLERAFGTQKVVPDEFAVVSRAPLAVPPDYALRPPRPGASPTQEVSASDQAKQTIFRAGDQTAALPGADQRSEGENALLKQAGAGSASPDIRRTVNQEAREAPVDQSLVDKLLFWRGPDYKLGPTDQVIDPKLEADRLKGGSATATAPTTPTGLSGTPLIERTKAPSLQNVL